MGEEREEEALLEQGEHAEPLCGLWSFVEEHLLFSSGRYLCCLTLPPSPDSLFPALSKNRVPEIGFTLCGDKYSGLTYRMWFLLSVVLLRLQQGLQLSSVSLALSIFPSSSPCFLRIQG